ncbi:shikimate dehydrogenase [Candidatus Gracilibacteria bacterium]|nr:shikimate dehydrogenase [Candidatus Gracilibacteria bacterium]
MKRFALIGDPVAYSRSPSLHRTAMSELEIEGEFVAIRVKKENLSDWLKYEGRNNFDGIAITSPHKETIRSFLDGESEVSRLIGAVNTLFWRDKFLVGTNTDAIGALRAIQGIINPVGKRVLLLGAGGAAKAIAFALLTAKAQVSLWNRTPEKALNLAHHFTHNEGKQALIHLQENLQKINPQDFDLVINATLVGLNEWKSLLPEDFWLPSHIAMEVIYTPLETKFLADAAAAGAEIITGDQMLIHQAVEQFHIWHGKEIDPDIMARAFFEN